MNWDVLICLRCSCWSPSMQLSGYCFLNPNLQWMAHEISGNGMLTPTSWYTSHVGLPSTTVGPRRGRPHWPWPCPWWLICKSGFMVKTVGGKPITLNSCKWHELIITGMCDCSWYMAQVTASSQELLLLSSRWYILNKKWPAFCDISELGKHLSWVGVKAQLSMIKLLNNNHTADNEDVCFYW